MLSAEQKLGGYAIVELVGRGGMGEVYRARQLSMEREVALKVLSPRLVRQDPAFAAKFVAEAQAAGRLNHPNIVAVHDVANAPAPEGCQGIAAGETVHYFSMEFISGETVRDVIERQGAVDLDLIARVMNGMVEALAFAEANRIVHRDIKPDNIMLPTLGGVKLADLGLALQIGEEDSIAGKDDQGRSKVMGTPLYIAPEQAQAKTVDHRSDQYALGATLFHMLTGRPPYHGDNSRSIMRSHCFDPVPDPMQANPQVPPPWRDLCMRLMAKEPAGRFTTSADLRTAVKAAARWRPGPTLRSRAQRQRDSWIRLAVIAVAAIIVLWLVFGLTQQKKAEMIPTPDRPTPSKPATPADPNAAAHERAAAQLAHLPSDPAAALVAVEALIANPSLAPARPELTKRRDEIQAGLRERRRIAQTGTLDNLERELVAGHLAEVRDGLAEVPEDPILHDRWEVLSSRLQAAERSVERRLAAAIAAAADAAGCDRISPEIESAGLPDQTRNDLRRRISERRAAILTASQQPDPAPLWRKLGDRLEPLRAAWPYAALAEACQDEARAFPDPDRELVRSLAEISELAQKAESALRTYIPLSTPKVEGRLGSKTGSFVLTRLEKDVIFFRLANTPSASETRVDRSAADLPWRQLLTAALADGKGDPRCEAAFLWYWRSTEAAAAIERLAQDPLAQALAGYTRRAGILEINGVCTRRDESTTVTYDFTQREAKQLTDWTGEGLTLLGQGLRWQTTQTIPPKDLSEGNLPGVRWKTSLKPPLTLDVTCLPDPGGADVLIGLAVGPRAVRVAISPARRKAFIVSTREKPDQYEVLGRPGLDVATDAPLHIQVILAANGVTTAKVNNQALTTERPLILPAGEAASVLFQIRLPSGRSGLTIPNLTVTGKP